MTWPVKVIFVLIIDSLFLFFIKYVLYMDLVVSFLYVIKYLLAFKYSSTYCVRILFSNEFI